MEGTSTVGTNCIIEKDGETEITIVVKGDVMITGSTIGRVNAGDVTNIKRYANWYEGTVLNDVEKLAADINNDGYITLEEDGELLSKYTSGTVENGQKVMISQKGKMYKIPERIEQ